MKRSVFYPRSLFGVMASLILAVTLSACSGTPSSTATSQLSSKTPINLTFWEGVPLPSEVQFINQKIAGFERQHSNVTITLSTPPYGQLPTKEAVALAAGTGPSIFAVGSSWYPQLLAANVLAPIAPQELGYSSLAAMKQAFQPGAVTPFTKGGKLMVLPYDGHSFSLYINTADFRAAGLNPTTDYPKTWSQALADAEKLVVKQNGKIVRNGIEFVAQNALWYQFNFEPILYQFGGNALSSNGKQCALNSSAGVKAADVLESFVSNGTWQPGLTTATASAATTDIASNLTAMIVAHPPTNQFIMASNPTMYNNGGFEVVPLPQVNTSNPVTGAYFNTLGINRDMSPQDKIAAEEFLRYFTANPSDFLSGLSGVISPVKSAANSSAYKSEKFMNVFLGDLSRGKLYTQSPYAAQVQSVEYTALQAILLNHADPQQALNQACQTLNQEIVQAGG